VFQTKYSSKFCKSVNIACAHHDQNKQLREIRCSFQMCMSQIKGIVLLETRNIKSNQM